MGAAARRSIRITIQTKNVVRSPSGDEVETWSDLATVWAERRDLRGGEYYQARSLNASVEVIFNILRIEGIDVESRIVCGSERFDVTRIVRVGNKNRELELYATSGVRDGR